jgi:hypothetical protein
LSKFVTWGNIRNLLVEKGYRRTSVSDAVEMQYCKGEDVVSVRHLVSGIQITKFRYCEGYPCGIKHFASMEELADAL